MSIPIEQTTDELLDWTIDWSTRGLGSDILATSAWEGSSDDFTISAPSKTDTTTTFWLTGGISGNVYNVTNTVTTSGGRTLQETIPYICLPRRIIGV